VHGNFKEPSNKFIGGDFMSDVVLSLATYGNGYISGSGTWVNASNASFTAPFNPNSYSFTAGNGIITSLPAGHYLIEASAEIRITSASGNATRASLGIQIGGGNTIFLGSNWADDRTIGVAGHNVVYVGANQSVAPRLLLETNPSGLDATYNAIIYTFTKC
jgi:hypothetical protein